MEKAVPIPFGATFVVPEGEQSKFKLQNMVFAKEDSQALFKVFLQSLNPETLGFKIVAGSQNISITVFFRWAGKTAGTVVWAHGGNDDQPKHIHGVSALLGKKNAQDDAKAIADAKDVKAVHRIKQDQFDTIAASVTSRGVATFFADVNSANYAPLITFIETFAAAFFHHLSTRQLLN